MVAVVVVTATVVTTGLGIDSVVVIAEVASVLLVAERGTTVLGSGLFKAPNPSVVPNGKSIVPGIPPVPS